MVKKQTGPRVVAIGGGNGLSTMLRGLKNRVRDLTAIVTVADDGGGSGMLRQDLGMLPPGDIRNCMQSLANVEFSIPPSTPGFCWPVFCWQSWQRRSQIIASRKRNDWKREGIGVIMRAESK